jgi:hypothetical protein
MGGGGMMGGMGGGGMMGGGMMGGMGGMGTPGGLIGSAINTVGRVSGGGVRGVENPVDTRGINSPIGKTLEIQQTAKDLIITNKEVAGGEDLVETFKLNGKDKVEMINTEGGSKVRQVTKIKLNKEGLTLTTTTMLPGGGSFTKKREYTINKDNKDGMVLKITLSGKGFSTQTQKLCYNKDKA